MPDPRFDVVVVGAGAAGLAAAIGLARAGFHVAAVEAAAYPGAENWSGCVYFCENLAEPDLLGVEGLESLAWERRLVERGLFATDGHGLLGMTYRDPTAFRHCYTVLRPIFDHHLAQVAIRHGVALLSRTTVESVLRDGGKVIGVCTNRGCLYADLVFLAEGDASHLVTREGYERYSDQREMPKFLQGIKQVIELPEGAIEERFGVGPQEGVAYEMLLRNGSLRGRSVRLNAGGFAYTNRTSLSVGLVLPVDHLNAQFGGDPNLLLEWFENLPSLQPWFKGGKRTVFGAKLIRGGGAKDIPHLIDDGLAIGGAASAIGVDLPYPNFTGPATAMGLLITRAACAIRREGGGFSKENLRRHYLEPLQQTHYWKDVEFLRRWPSYVKRTQVFFDKNIDLALGSAYIWTRPRSWLLTRWTNWLRMVAEVAGPTHWGLFQSDLRHLVRSLRLRQVISRPALGRLLFDGTLNAARDLFGAPRAHLPAAGEIRIHHSVAGEPTEAPPFVVRRWFSRFAPVLASAAHRIYRNDDAPLARKAPEAVQLLVKQINVLDLFGAALLALGAGVTSAIHNAWDRLRIRMNRQRPGASPPGLYSSYAQAARTTIDMTPSTIGAGARWEGRLGHLEYETSKESHIQVLWPLDLAAKEGVVEEDLWHVCPAHVYEARTNAMGQAQVVVNFENCIKCETCWRASDLVDWGRDGRHRFTYPVHSPSMARLLEAAEAAAFWAPKPPRSVDSPSPSAAAPGQAGAETGNGKDSGEGAELYALMDKLDRKLVEFDVALGEEPRTVDHSRAEHLESLARYAVQLSLRVVEVLRVGAKGSENTPDLHRAQLLSLAAALQAKCEERARRTWDKRFRWAAADGRQIRFHHLATMRPLARGLERRAATPASIANPTLAWLRCESRESDDWDMSRRLAEALDAAFPANAWRDLEKRPTLDDRQDACLLAELARIPRLPGSESAAELHAPERKLLLAELGRRDPSLAYRAAAHLWARDLAGLVRGSPALSMAAERWAKGAEWASFASVDASIDVGGSCHGQALLVPVEGVSALLLLLNDEAALVPVDLPGLKVERLAMLGLRGAGLARVAIERLPESTARFHVDGERLRRVWHILSSADLTSIAFGMADQLCQRAIAHATSRVQFPGLFQDETARDPIAKFGAVKKMIAEMGARRYVIQTLDRNLTPLDFSSPSFERAIAVKALTAEALGSAPGSLTYNAGQVFGGTGYSEDDILAKYYRDGAAWRFLGMANAEAYLRLGDHLLRDWQPDGRRLSTLHDEATLFDQLAQRKALQAELDEVRVLRSRLRSLVNDCVAAWRDASHPVEGSQTGLTLPNRAALAEAQEQLARQNAVLLASKALLLRTHSRLEQGFSSETETALLRVWLEGAAVALEAVEASLHWHMEPDDRGHDRPLVDPAVGPPVSLYADYLKSAVTYDSGEFLSVPLDLAEPRLVPEMVETDPDLAKKRADIIDLLQGYFSAPRNGLRYERHAEKQHHADPEDIAFCRKHGFFRMPIPKELGGEGRQKLEYYFVTNNVHRIADVGLSLTIQVNTGLGTSPIAIARDKDLPKAEKEMATFVRETETQLGVRSELDNLAQRLAENDLDGASKWHATLRKRVEDAVLRRGAVRVLAHRFVQAWQQAGQALRAFDLAAMKPHVKEAVVAWNAACEKAKEFHEEIGRRREACDLYLRWIASGQISGFALTEPSAGSDTARVATRAKPRSVVVERVSDGVYRFVPHGESEPRVLLDARRLEFRPEGVYYRLAEGAQSVAIRFDEYDYETDAPDRLRYLEAGPGSQRVPFHDIAQLRERDGKLWYDYWELTGAKMWITNGRICGVLCLYAKTDEGVTGFLVDRHSEGLVVGKDEAKLGQCSSPTNEVALQGARVPRENVLGLEGRGQVNALETLNVGRAGLSMSAMTQMEGLIESSRAFARSQFGEIPESIAWRIQRMEQARFVAEALAHEMIGRFEHKGTKSVRLESAIAKMLVSEMLHQVIEWAEEIHGPAGQTQHHYVEKRKRDARILNIYEGTNEIQRFFLLKELAGDVAGRWPKIVPAPANPHRDILAMEALKAGFRKRFSAALELFGQGLWQNPNLQANCFLLSEAMAWLKGAESALYRIAWLERHSAADENADPLPPHEAGRAALAWCQRETESRLRRFDEELAHLRRGHYAPEIRAANLLFESSAPEERTTQPASSLERPLRIVLVLEPTAATVPEPCIQAGRLLEASWSMNAADRAALETALRLRAAGPELCRLEAIAAGPRIAAPVLRDTLSHGFASARLLLTPTQSCPADLAARALAPVLRQGPPIDLLLGGTSAADQSEGSLARLLAEALDIPFGGSAQSLRVLEGQRVELHHDGARPRSRSIPAAILLEAGLEPSPYSIADYCTGLSKHVEIIPWPEAISAKPAELSGASSSAQKTVAAEAPRALDVGAAARFVLEASGRRAAAAADTAPYDGPIGEVTVPDLPQGSTLAVLAAEGDGQLTQGAPAVIAAARLAVGGGLTGALVWAPAAEDAQRRLAGTLRNAGFDRVILLIADPLSMEPEVRAKLIREAWTWRVDDPHLVIGEAWLEGAFAALGMRGSGRVLPRVRRLERRNGELVAELSRDQGKLRVIQSLGSAPAWITLASDVAIPPTESRPKRDFAVARWRPALKALYSKKDIQQLLEDLKQETGVVRLSDADFILDVGFGVANRDGYEEVIDPLERALRDLGVHRLAIGGSRKVTEELRLLPLDRQIGQSGVRVNPRILLAIGVSGAPQHLDYIGGRASILAFNRDPEAPLMTLNQRQAQPRVFPILGDLFETVPALTAALRKEKPS